MRLKLALLCLAFAVLPGCATVSQENNQDPWEGMNRKVFAFNMTLDRYAIKPAAKAYRWALPAYLRDRIRGLVNNLTEPLVFANDALQGRVKAASITLGRFVVNSTVGLAGMYDIAAAQGLRHQSGDFGQTLYTWGFDSGPYLVLPFFGPSDLRDTFGLGVDIYSDPVWHLNFTRTWTPISFGMSGVRYLDLRAQNIETLDNLQANSLDFYATMRSIYQQHRRAQLQEARPSKTTESEEPFDIGPTPPENPPSGPGTTSPGPTPAPGNGAAPTPAPGSESAPKPPPDSGASPAAVPGAPSPESAPPSSAQPKP